MITYLFVGSLLVQEICIIHNKKEREREKKGREKETKNIKDRERAREQEREKERNYVQRSTNFLIF